ncbi:hypothetical protein BJ993_004568 [Nocardioides aromaticivorans]|uniref:DUF4190 domain-containing protein n=1 Tax=Nocardioides aromaticivorans TaxID=200618 RepID=A0A7Z0CQL7_9ACTN|nr:DUF4190 domain-containing protein [Nocardioides aromaticivorans]NYI47488.1 hypothetical protein [Nocardioides aromaticivorans]
MNDPTSSYPPPPGPIPPGPFQPTPARPPSNGLAVAALVIGIVALTIALIPILNLVGVVGTLVGIPLGIAGVRKGRRVGRGTAMAGAGIALSGVALVLSAVISFLFWRYLGDLLDFVEPPDPSAEIGEEFETDGGDLVVTVTSLECGTEPDECTFTFDATNNGHRSISLDDITVKSVVDGQWDSADVSDPGTSSYGVDLAPGESKSLTGSVRVYSGEHLDGIVFDANDASSHSAVVVDAGDASPGQ